MKTVPLRSLVDESRLTVQPSEMGELVLHFSIPALDQGEPVWVQSADIDSHKLRLRGGEILISRLNPRIPRVHMVPRTLPVESVASTEFVALTPRPAADPNFTRYFLLSSAVRGQLHSEVRSATRSHQRVDPDVILQLRVPKLGPSEQRRIADFLDDRVARIDQIIAARRQQICEVADLFKSRSGHQMDALTAKFGTVPIRRIVAGIEQGSSPVGLDRPAEADEHGLLKTNAIDSGTFHPARNKAIPVESADARFRVEEGDVLVIRGSGSAALVGDAAVASIANYPGALYLSDLTYRLVGVQALPQFIVMAILSPRGRSELGALVRQGSGPAKARGADILALPSPAVPLREQREAVAHYGRAAQHRTQISSALGQSIDLLTEYKSSLITAAVTGELDVTTASRRIPGE